MLRLMGELLLGCGIGAGVVLARIYWLNWLEERMIDAFIQEEEEKIQDEYDKYVRIFELLLVGIQPESDFCLVAPSPVVLGVAIMQIIFEEGDELNKMYARADGFDVTIISCQEFAAIASYELVKAIPCVEDMDSDDFWEEDDEDYEESVD